MNKEQNEIKLTLVELKNSRKFFISNSEWVRGIIENKKMILEMADRIISCKEIEIAYNMIEENEARIKIIDEIIEERKKKK